jgi:phage anti-repressor protein
MKLKRDPIKYIRDRAKAAYNKGSHCYICNTTEKLDFHHFYTLTPLFNKWCRDNKIVINTEEDILAVRDRFIEENRPELYDHAVTLCHAHHMKLHSIYGKDPALTTATKQMNWVKIQREKHELPILDC